VDFCDFCVKGPHLEVGEPSRPNLRDDASGTLAVPTVVSKLVWQSGRLKMSKLRTIK
jgi:hypothetical protein